jgi:pimeloyl-ACP methyl ester carboxylesterase
MRENMATYVLVHGAWHGSWCWQRVRTPLQSEGHTVFTPTLAGLGERSHLLSKDVRLQTHIDDVANLIRWEGLEDVILCGHSYAGMVVTGVAEALPEKIKTLVYLDAFLPTSGKSLNEVCPPELAALHREMAVDGDGWQMRPFPAATFAVNDVDQAWVDRQCTRHPLATFEDRIEFTDRATSIADIRYILCTGWSNPVLASFADTARQRDWSVSMIAAGHDAMLDDPAALVKLLR